MVNKINELRLQKKISVTELSRRADLSRTTIYKLENGNTNPSLKTINKLSSGLKEKPEKIFDFYVIQELQKGDV
ncbi:helix-turn-helix transcriptional regulator [Staphylococcus xylosus]